MPDKQTIQTRKKVSQSQRKTGGPYVASQPLVSTPKVTKKDQ